MQAVLNRASKLYFEKTIAHHDRAVKLALTFEQTFLKQYFVTYNRKANLLSILILRPNCTLCDSSKAYMRCNSNSLRIFALIELAIDAGQTATIHVQYLSVTNSLLASDFSKPTCCWKDPQGGGSGMPSAGIQYPKLEHIKPLRANTTSWVCKRIHSGCSHTAIPATPEI